MKGLNLKELENGLRNSGFSDQQLKDVEKVIDDSYRLPPTTYDKAVLGLIIITGMLAFGGILLPAIGAEIPEALWGVIGAGVGGLAGIFMGEQK